MMNPATDKPKSPSKILAPKAETKEELKSLLMPEVEKQLASSPKGLTQTEAKERIAQYGPTNGLRLSEVVALTTW